MIVKTEPGGTAWSRGAGSGLLAVALAVALAGCGGGAGVTGVITSTGSNAASGTKLQLQTGLDALEPALVRVHVVADPDVVLPNGGLGTKALPAVNTWDNVTVRLSSSTALSADRVVTIPRTSFSCSGGPPVTSCASSSAIFTKLRPTTGYKLQISVIDSTTSPANVSEAVENVNFDLQSGASQNVTITLKQTSGGTGLTVSATSTSSDTGLYSGTLNNSFTAISGNIPVVTGDTMVISSGLSDAGTQAQTTPQGGPAGTTTLVSNLLENETGVLSRVIVSIAQGSTAPTSAAPGAGEKIVGNYFRSGNEQTSGLAWASTATTGFYGGTNAGTTSTGQTGSVALANTTVTGTLNTGFAGTVNWTVAVTDTTPNITAITNEASASTNALIVYRYYDNTFDHHLIAIKTQNLFVESGASLGLTIN